MRLSLLINSLTNLLLGGVIFFQYIRREAQVLHNTYLEYLRLGNGLQITRGPKSSSKTYRQKLNNGWDKFDRDNSIPDLFNHTKHINDPDLTEVYDDEDDDNV